MLLLQWDRTVSVMNRKGIGNQKYPVTESIPQRLILGLVLFNISINGQDDGVLCKHSKFADDIKLGGRIDIPRSCAAVQKELDRLEKLANRNLVKFNEEKCEVLHLGKNSPRQLYILRTTQLESSSAEKDLRVLADTRLNMRQLLPLWQNHDIMPS